MSLRSNMIRNGCAEHVSVTAFLVRSLRRRWIRLPIGKRHAVWSWNICTSIEHGLRGKDTTKALVPEILKTETELNTRSILTHDLREVNVYYFIRLNIQAVNGVIHDLTKVFINLGYQGEGKT